MSQLWRLFLILVAIFQFIPMTKNLLPDNTFFFVLLRRNSQNPICIRHFSFHCRHFDRWNSTKPQYTRPNFRSTTWNRRLECNGSGTNYFSMTIDDCWTVYVIPEFVAGQKNQCHSGKSSLLDFDSFATESEVNNIIIAFSVIIIAIIMRWIIINSPHHIL